MAEAVTYVEIDVPSFVTSSPEETQTFRFAVPASYLSQDIEAIPIVRSISFTPQRISLGKGLGERASITVTLDDCLHVFNGEPYDQGTFWGKWRGRYGAKLRGREMRVYRGDSGQTLEQMDVRYYVVDTTDGPSSSASYTIVARDILKLADDDRAQAPTLSNGSLAGSINDSATAITLSPSGIGDLEYDASGWVCLGGKEVVSFNRSGDTMTIVRAQFGTVAQSHDSGDRVQTVLRFTGDDPADIIYTLLTEYTSVPASYINLAEWQVETSTYLNVIYARTITEPVAVRELIAQIIEQAQLVLWWDDRARMLRLNVLREISTDADTFDQDIILEGTLDVREQPTKRTSQIWTFYGQRDPTDSGANEDNYRSALADVALEEESEYGSAEIVKIRANWIETEAAATRLNSIYLSRFRDPPRMFSFSLPVDSVVSPVSGYQLRWWGNQDEQGAEVPALIQLTQVTFESDRIRVEAEEMLASGVVVLVNIVFLEATDGSVLEFDVPEDWNDNDNEVHCIGAGGGAAASAGQSGGKGAGGGAYSGSVNLILGSSPGSTVQYSVGVGGTTSVDGGDTWFDGASLAASTVGAEGGQGGVGRTGNGQGGQASSGVGDTRYSGGDGGNGGATSSRRCGGGGGGAAAGPNGDGGNGGSTGGNEPAGSGGGGADGGEDVTDIAQGGTGTDGGDNRFGFGGGNSTTPVGQEGGGGKGGNAEVAGHAGGTGEQIWTQTVAPIVSAGPGGGGGGGGGSFQPGGAGGEYGGGGGGGSGNASSGGTGGYGIIVIIWRPAEA